MSNQRFSFYVTPEEIRSYFYQYDPNQIDKKEKIWLHSRIQADILLQLLDITRQKKKSKNSSEPGNELVTLTIKKSGSEVEFQYKQDILLAVIAMTAMDKNRSTVQRSGKKNVRNIPTSSNLLSIILLNILDKKLRGNMKNELIENAINCVYQPYKKELDLEDFTKPYQYKVSKSMLETHKKIPMSEELYQALVDTADIPDGWKSLKIFNRWKEARIQEFPDEKHLINDFYSAVEDEKVLQIDIMALNKVKDEIVLTFVNDNRQTFSITRYQLIHLIEPEHRTKTLVPYSGSDYSDNRLAVAEVIGALDRESGRMIIAEGEKGKPITPESGLVRKYEFKIDIDQLVSYYIVFKREWEDRLKFEQLLNMAKPEPCFDLLAN